MSRYQDTGCYFLGDNDQNRAFEMLISSENLCTQFVDLVAWLKCTTHYFVLLI